MRTEIAIAVDNWHEEKLKNVCTHLFTFILISIYKYFFFKFQSSKLVEFFFTNN